MRVCFRFVRSGNGILLWLALFSSVMLFCFCLFFVSWRSQISSICSIFFINCSLSLPHSLNLVSNSLHDRYLYSNAITSIPSGAFTGLTALTWLWGKGAVIPLCGLIVLSTTLESPHCPRECVLDFRSLAMVYYCDSLLINLMMSLFFSWRSQIFIKLLSFSW